uniref:R-spondin 3 n=1 Tax=Scleropages formosus TaxID=113540 RepID=A0A8C9TR23_SCLFO
VRTHSSAADRPALSAVPHLSDKLFFFFSESIPGTPRTSCYGGCLTCSDSNGCLSCKPRYFFLLDRLGMRQVGMCLLSCPSGYYHIRSRDINKCSKCQLDCDCDFTGNFCTRCRQGLYLLQGKCHSACPEEFFANEQLMECKPQVHCEVGEWGSWSPCFRGGSTCGFKLGEQIRTRDVLLVTPSNSHPCPAVSEKRDCISKKKKCPGASRTALFTINLYHLSVFYWSNSVHSFRVLILELFWDLIQPPLNLLTWTSTLSSL